MPTFRNQARFRDFVARFATLVESAGSNEPRIFAEGVPMLSDLVSHDDWLPEACAQPIANGYRQYLLYCDARARLSVVSFVWGPGVQTPIHDHTVWGMVGILRGAEICHEYALPVPGAPLVKLGSHRVVPGDVDRVSPAIGDVHVVENALADRPSISIHAYGGDIGAIRRHRFEPDGRVFDFISGYNNTSLPNFWDRSQGT